MQHGNTLKSNGNFWSSLGKEECKNFLAGQQVGSHHPSRLAVKEFLTKKKLRKGSSLLEIPCGSGTEYTLLSEKFAYTGMDKTPELIQAFKERVPDVDVRLGDIREIPEKDNAFDIVYARAIFEHLCDESDVEQAMKECFRVAKKIAVFSFYLPLGKDTAINWNGHFFENRYSREFVDRVISSLGAQSVEEEFVNVEGTDFLDSYTIFYVSKT